jgi:hypothetical protein
MAAVTSDVTPATRKRFELLETIAITNAAATATRTRALRVPDGAKACMFVLDITIAGTTPLFDFKVEGGQIAGGRSGASLDATTDIFEFTSGGPASITQLTTANSTPITTVSIGPGIQTDTTGSATVNSAYAFSCAVLPQYLIYTYTYDGTTTDEDYNGTVSVYWDNITVGLDAVRQAAVR